MLWTAALVPEKLSSCDDGLTVVKFAVDVVLSTPEILELTFTETNSLSISVIVTPGIDRSTPAYPVN